MSSFTSSQHGFSFKSTYTPNALTSILLGLLIIMLFTACDKWSNEATKIKIIFTETDPARRLNEVFIEDGGDDFYWHYITGEESINLLPDPRAERQLTLQYRMDTDPAVSGARSWQGPKFEKGTGYRIEIKINGRGEITERHCILPCSLD